ncbi:MAG: malonic semialdehyde reductase [Novosphingobium sp.]|nr:malonic semialdehyde reductase [Novosphingobium sp.]
MSQPLPEAALDQLFRTARTYNGYLDKPVTIEQLRQIWELMKFGPTSANMLPARLVWCVSQEAKDKLAACSSGTNAPKIQKAPVSLIIGMDTAFHEHLPRFFPHAPGMKDLFGGLPVATRNEMALRNSSLQGAYFIIAARALGLDTGPMSGFDNAVVDAAFFSDAPNIKSNFISTLGYGDPATIFARSPRPEFDEFNTIV